MKNKMQIFILAILILSVLSLVIIYLVGFDFLYIVGYKKSVHFFYLKLTLAFYFSLLSLLAFKSKNFSFYYFLNLIWLIPVFLVLFSNFVSGTYNLEKIDYLLGKKIKKFEVIQIPDARGWKLNKFTVNKDAIYYNQNPSMDTYMYTQEELQKAKISKSWITGEYYVIIDKK